MRSLALLLLVIAGCDAAPLGHRSDVGAMPADAGTDAATIADAFAPIDAARTDAATIDAWSCMPTRTSCNAGLECGALPDGCPGGTFDCGVCGDGIDTCEIQTSMFQTRVYNCTQMVQTANDTWFDPVMFRDTSSWLVLDAHANDYVAAMATCADGGGRTAIVDPGAPGNEIRVRPSTGGGAENFIVRTYGTGRTAAHYTSTCSPAGF